jgi:hypothetical protein
MKRIKKLLLILLVVSLISLPLAPYASRFTGEVQAATDTANPSTGSPGYFIMPFNLTGALTGGTLTEVIKFNMPFPAKLLGVYASVRAHTGVQTVMVLNAGATMLSSVITLTAAGTVYEGALTATASKLLVADEAAVSITYVTNTSATDTSILLIFKR